MSNATPLVSIIIDTYNNGPFIEESIASALDQDFPTTDFEVLVIDDGSTDETESIIATFGDRIRYIRKENGGQSSAFNVGFEAAKGKYLTLLDGDDTCTPNRARIISEEFASHPEVGMILSSMHRLGDEIDLQETRPELHNVKLSHETLQQIHKCSFGIGRTSLRRSVLHHVMPLPEKSPIGADIYLLSLLWFTNISSLPHHMTIYRLHDGNRYATPSADAAKAKAQYTDNEISAIRKRIEQVPGYDKRLLDEFLLPFEHMRDTFRYQYALHTEKATRSDLAKLLLQQVKASRRDWSFSYRLYKYLRIPFLLLPPPHLSEQLRESWLNFSKPYS